MRRRTLEYVLLAVAAGARLLLAMAAMPPYAGLDEVYHVARLAFVAQEGRQPSTSEKSVAHYLNASIEQKPEALADFALIGERWPEVVVANPQIVNAHPNGPMVYERPNYEGQQASLYYWLVSHVRGENDVAELRLWRLGSVFFALVTILAAAVLLTHWFGRPGFVAAALIVSFPTWITLVVRAGNDALACALLAVALALTVRNDSRRPGGPAEPDTATAQRGHASLLRTLAEALAWGGALATKLYTWPGAIVIPLCWWKQRASRWRMTAVVLVCVVAAGLTLLDLSHRSSNPVGVFGFDKPLETAAPRPIRYGEMMRITIASALWTSGQHNDALTLRGMMLFAAPLLVIAFLSLRRMADRKALSIAVVALTGFGIAQGINAMGFIRQARAAGLALPLGGKEGWYWYALAPLLVMFLAGAPRVAAAWLVTWDILITEGALFHDFAGAASPLHPSALFRWGPMQAPFTAGLSAIGVGPLASHLVALRLLHLAALSLLIVTCYRGTRAPRV